MEKLLLVDGHNLLFQMFYGMPNKIYGKDGNSYHGVFGFIGGLLKSVNMISPNKLLIIFDGENNGNRKIINNNYKANRIDYTQVPIEENPFSQYEGIKKALDYMNIMYYETNGYETDDLIASYVYKYHEKMKIIIQSSDTDFLQLVNTNVCLFRYRGKNSLKYTKTEVVNKYGVTPDKIAQLKSLVGDNSDNLKGVCKVGVKTAAKLLNKFNSIDEIYHNIDNIKSNCIRENLIKAKELVYQNYSLISLEESKSIPLPYKIEDLTCNLDDHNYKTLDILREINIM